MTVRRLLICSFVVFLLLPTAIFAAGQGEEAAVSMDEEMDVDVFYWLGSSELDDDGDDMIINLLEDRFNVDISWTYNREYLEALRLRIASGDYPDWFIHRQYTDYKAMYEDGLTHNLSDYMSDYSLTGLQAYLSRDDLQMLKEDDGWHNIPRWVGAMTHSLYYRKDWADQLGIEVSLDQPPSMDEFYDILKAFVEADPEGNNTTGIVAFSSWWHEHMAVPFAGVYEWGTLDGEVISDMVHPGYREFYSFYAKLYEEGLLDPELATTNKNVAVEKFHTGRSGMILGHSSSGFRTQTLQEPIRERVPNAEVGLLLWPAGPEGAALKGRPPVFGFNGFNPDLSESELVRILQIVDFLCSAEGQDLAWFGIEGVHHEVVDGQKVKLEDVQQEKWGGTPYWAHEMLMGQILRRQYEEDPVTSRANEFNAEHQVINPLHFWTGDMVNTLNAEVSEVFTRWWFDFVLGEKDPNTDWDDYVEALNDAGLAELTELAAEEMEK